MRIREMRAKARESLKGRWGQIIPIVLFMQIIGSIFNVILTELQGKATDRFNNINMSYTLGYFGVWIIYLCLSCALTYVFIGKSIKFNRGNDIGFSEYLQSVTDKFGRALKVGVYYIGYVIKRIWKPLLIAIVSIIFTMALPLLAVVYLIAIVFVVVRGIEATYDYSLVYYLANDYEDKEFKDLFEKSKELMYGNRAKYMVVPLTFIGWILLALAVLVWLSFGVVLSIRLHTIGISEFVLNCIVESVVLIIVPLITYIMLTMTNFYESFNPTEIFNEGYVKPEAESTKYIIIVSIIAGVTILLPFILSLIISVILPMA